MDRRSLMTGVAAALGALLLSGAAVQAADVKVMTSVALKSVLDELTPAFEKKTLLFGIRLTLTPPASASVLSPRRKLSQARCTATRDPEHAVSNATLGPRRSITYDRRLATMLFAVPAPEYASARRRSSNSR